MKTFAFGAAFATFILLLIVMPPAVPAGEPARSSLAAHRNQDRVLLVFAPSERSAAYQEQLRFWRGDRAGFADRDLVVMPVFKEGTPAATGTPHDLPTRYAAEVQSFQVVLIGKDGHEAYRSDKPVTAEELYRRIDAMPMRREEMTRKQKTKGKFD